MQQNQKEICISITKIFNWTQPQHQNEIQLQFYPLIIQTPIIEKKVKGTLSENCLLLNAVLKINYTTQENIIKLKVISKKLRKDQVLGMFEINLDDLNQKKIQYFPLSSKDKVLQINTVSYEPQRKRITTTSSRHTIQRPSMKNSYYQQQQQPNNNKPYDNSGGRFKKSFSQKIFTLLNQVKSIRESQEQIEIDYQKDRKIKKSYSDKYVLATKKHKPTENKTNSSLKNRLILNSLDVVPCSDYYGVTHRYEQKSQFNNVYQSSQKFRK